MTFLACLTTPVLIVFITLKITSVIDWNWWLVGSPVFLSVILMVTRNFFRPRTDTERVLDSLIDRG